MSSPTIFKHNRKIRHGDYVHQEPKKCVTLKMKTVTLRRLNPRCTHSVERSLEYVSGEYEDLKKFTATTLMELPRMFYDLIFIN